MIAGVIQWSLDNRVIVLLVSLILLVVGVFSILRTPLDAIPDLSDVQVIIKTPYPGQAPQGVEDQVTYPLTTAMLSVPGAVTVRSIVPSRDPSRSPRMDRSISRLVRVAGSIAR